MTVKNGTRKRGSYDQVKVKITDVRPSFTQTIGPGAMSSYEDTEGNYLSGIYEESLQALIIKFPVLVHEHTHPEIGIRLIQSGLITDQGEYVVGPNLQKKLGVNKDGKRVRK